MHLAILRRCGWTLIAMGALDIAYLGWCIVNRQSYSSSLSVFAVVGGIFLVRGNLTAARWVAALATFVLTACVVGLLVMPFLYPLGYWLAVFRHGSGWAVSGVTSGVLIVLLAWVLRQTMRREVLEAQRAAGLPPPPFKLPLALGVALPLVIMSVLGLMLRGETALEAIRRAEQECGGQYRYVVSSLQISSNQQEKRVVAVVTAYNETEIKSLQVTWTE